ncbi:MAG TPA: NADH-quinone oxidoreductase subunit J [Steroidobacteraceae bacterium]|nr:NADH-quinone oxidoreductase subunit J [Steroidobacteraceae bacterium]
MTLYIEAAVAVIATVFAITNYHPLHALLYLIASLLAVAMVFFTLGAPFAGALEVIVYAGAIMVLFVFVVMLLNLGQATNDQERDWLRPRVWIGPGLLSLTLLLVLVRVLVLGSDSLSAEDHSITAAQVGVALYGPYLLAVELSSMLLLAGLVTALHLGRQE